ncbi:MAG: tetratricopeptide repeat protein [Limnospira sp. PMC 737.11]|uniref:Tetratricopeptide repeat protein n=1 Tax=Limnospira fusiformis PMC 851.14 TaxID=2219512 RepID=A0ABU9ETF1_LIMFS|nr:tetratricopeptide repeat protein [Limnospira sp. PMC 737.11]MDT9276960.1 tetratricopeptide repeat protein [Limnospira sp. PMC 737.11]
MNDFNRGNELLRKGKVEEAVAAYQKAIAHDPSFHWYHEKLGEAFEELQHWEKAIAAYQKAIALNSDCAWFYYQLGRAFAHQEDWETAIINYRKAIAINPSLQLLHSSLNYALEADQLQRKSTVATPKVITNPDNLRRLDATSSPDSKPSKNMFWVASYPKSGNTWMRYILAHLLFGASEREDVRKKVGQTIPDLHYQKNVFDAPEINFSRCSRVAFAKTHTCGFPDLKTVNPVGFIYIYRHPLDVLMSAINYSYISGHKHFFHDHRLHSPEELKQNGKINWYVERFMQNLQIDNFYQMSNTWLNHVNTWLELSENHQMSLVVKYEDLLDNTFEHLKKLSDLFEKTDKEIQKAIEFSQKHTNDGGKFFWKKKSRNYQDYLDKKLIARFNSKYATVLSKLGYDNF